MAAKPPTGKLGPAPVHHRRDALDSRDGAGQDAGMDKGTDAMAARTSRTLALGAACLLGIGPAFAEPAPMTELPKMADPRMSPREPDRQEFDGGDPNQDFSLGRDFRLDRDGGASPPAEGREPRD